MNIRKNFYSFDPSVHTEILNGVEGIMRLFKILKNAGISDEQRTVIEGSEEEKSLMEKCTQLGITLYVIDTYLIVDKKNDILNYPFYNLAVKENKRFKWEQLEENMSYDFAERFNAAGGFYPVDFDEEDKKQKYKIFVDFEKSKKIDIMASPHIYDLFIISKRMKNLIEEEGFTGATVRPCLKYGQKYTEEEMDVNSKVRRLNEEAEFFQLDINTETKRPPSRIIKLSGHGMLPFGSINDLEKIDFQFYNKLISEDNKVKKVGRKSFIVSSKFLKRILDLKFKGIDIFLDIQKIKYAPVEIKGITF